MQQGEGGSGIGLTEYGQAGLNGAAVLSYNYTEFVYSRYKVAD